MIFAVIADLAKLVLIVVCIYLIVWEYVRRKQPTWSGQVKKRRLAIVLILVLAVIAIKVSEDVLDNESGVFDRAILLFVHEHVPGGWTGFFETITLSGSSTVLLLLTGAGSIMLLYGRYRFEAVLLSASVLGGATLVYLLKTMVGRVRPTLWETEWYWGSSFPSGHTLVVAAFATAAVLCMNRIRPAARELVLPLALLWICLVAISRLVLGVHWPTDVLAAACIGAVIPLLISLAFDLVNVGLKTVA